MERRVPWPCRLEFGEDAVLGHLSRHLHPFILRPHSGVDRALPSSPSATRPTRGHHQNEMYCSQHQNEMYVSFETSPISSCCLGVARCGTYSVQHTVQPRLLRSRLHHVQVHATCRTHSGTGPRYSTTSHRSGAKMSLHSQGRTFSRTAGHVSGVRM